MATEPKSALVQRAAGDALDALGDPPRHPAPGSTPLLTPAQALAALLAAGIAELSLEGEPQLQARTAVQGSLRAEATTVGCTFELLSPARAAVPLQVPMPSWCAWLVARGVLHWESEPALDATKSRLQQRFTLAVLRGGRPQRFAFDFSGAFARGARPELFIALAPGCLSNDWKGPVCVRVALAPERRFSIGPPAHPDGATVLEGQGTLTWVISPEAQKLPAALGPAGDGKSWPAAFPEWLTVRAETRRGQAPPTALFWLPALWHRRFQRKPEAGGRDPRIPGGARLSLGIDIGSRTTGVTARADGGSELSQQLDLPSDLPLPSGFALLSGEARSAHRHGCGESLELRDGYLPTALQIGSPAALRALLRAPEDDEAVFQAWLPQVPPGLPQGDAVVPRLELFKSPELLHHAEALPDLLAASELAATRPDLAPAQASFALMHAYGRLLGHAVAALHASPGSDPHAPARAAWPDLQEVSVAMAFPKLRWPEHGASGPKTYAELYQAVGERLCSALRFAWARVEGPRLVADPDAAKAMSPAAPAEHERIQVVADFGGLTLQISCELLAQPGRPAPLIAGSTMTYVLGGERWLEAAAFALAGQKPDVRSAYAGELRGLRNLVGNDAPLDPRRAGAIGSALLAKVSALISRQVHGTLTRAAQHAAGFRGASAHVLLLGDGWKLFALDRPSAEREAALRAGIVAEARGWLRAAEVSEVRVERRTKQDLCKGAITAGATSGLAPPLVPLHLVPTSGQEPLSWFASPDPDGDGRAAIDTSDLWWADELKGPSGPAALCTPSQWLTAAGGSRFANRLRGTETSYEARQPLLEQFLRTSGPSLIALHIYDLLGS